MSRAPGIMATIPANRSFVVRCGTTMISGLGLNLISPILPIYARTFGVSLASVGLLISGLGLARIFTNLPAGHLGDRVGSRPVLVLSCLVIAVSALGAGWTNDFSQLLLFRILQGVGSALQNTTAFAALAKMK